MSLNLRDSSQMSSILRHGSASNVVSQPAPRIRVASGQQSFHQHSTKDLIGWDGSGGEPVSARPVTPRTELLRTRTASDLFGDAPPRNPIASHKRHILPASVPIGQSFYSGYRDIYGEAKDIQRPVTAPPQHGSGLIAKGEEGGPAIVARRAYLKKGEYSPVRRSAPGGSSRLSEEAASSSSPSSSTSTATSTTTTSASASATDNSGALWGGLGFGETAKPDKPRGKKHVQAGLSDSISMGNRVRGRLHVTGQAQRESSDSIVAHPEPGDVGYKELPPRRQGKMHVSGAAARESIESVLSHEGVDSPSIVEVKPRHGKHHIRDNGAESKDSTLRWR